MPKLKRLFASGTIQARLLTIALVPSVAALLVGVILSGYLVTYGLQVSSFAGKLGDASATTTRFISDIQDERRLTLQWLSDRRQNRTQLDETRSETDAVVSEMDSILERMADDAPGDLEAGIQDLRQKLGAMKDVRGQVDNGPGDLDAAYDYYNGLLDTFGLTMRAFARSAPDAAVAYEQVMAVDLFEAAESLSRGHALAAARTTTGMNATQFHEYIHQIGAFHEDLDSLKPRMTPQEQAHYKAISKSPAWNHLDAVQDALEAAGGEANSQEVIRLPISTQDWQSAQHDLTGQLDSLYREHTDYATGIGNSTASTTLTTSLIGGVAILVVAAGVFLFAFRLSRRLIRRLDSLREETLDLADRKLPSIVERLRAGERINVESEVSWLDHGGDEIGQVADAFNKAQRTAINSTVHEAETRQGVRSVFLNIAHRSQVMVHRQLQALDKAERSQEDPEQLEMLFELDHLATQSRRNAENLVILGGERPGRQWRNPVTLLEVVRGAVAEIEHYTRVEPGHLPDVSLQGAVVADTIHLLAELLDNATAFSPPESYVQVHGGIVGKGIVVEIEDQGLGMEPDKLEQLNTMLRTPPDFGVMALSSESRMGLFVVAQLAARHDIRITLRESAYGGIHALVLIPTVVMAREISADEASTDVGAWPPVQDQPDERPPQPSQPQPRMSGQLTSEQSQSPALPQKNGRATPAPSPRPEPASNGGAPASRPEPASNGGAPASNGSGSRTAPNDRKPATGSMPYIPEINSPSNSSTVDGNRPGFPPPGPPQAEPAPRPEPPRPTSLGGAEPANGNGNGAGRVGGQAKQPLPQRKRQANIAAPLRESADRQRPEPEQKSNPQDGPPRTPEHFRATMSAFQHGTRRARVSDADAKPGSTRPKGEEA